MLLRIDFESETPIYRQLRDQIVLGLARGELAEGESLPSVRQLAGDLGVNMHTVNKAYAMLRAESFIVIHKQKGALVARREGARADEAAKARLALDFEPLVAECVARGITRAETQALIAKVYAGITNPGGQP